MGIDNTVIKFIFNEKMYLVTLSGNIYLQVGLVCQRSGLGTVTYCRRYAHIDRLAKEFLESYDAEIMSRIIKDRHPSEVF